MKVNCWNEYSTLKTVILGSMYDLDRIPQIYKGRDQESFIKIVEDTDRELKNFQTILEQHGVTVLRPKQPADYENIDLSKQAPLLNMRDFHMAYGPIFFMSRGSYDHRKYQHLWVEDIVNDMIKSNNLVVNMNDTNLEKVPLRGSKKKSVHFSDTYTKTFKGKNLYHTASILKNNKTAYASKIPGTDIGKSWIISWLDHLGVEYVEVNNIGHLDGTNSLLSEDLALVYKDSTLKEFFPKHIVIPHKKDITNWTDTPSLFEKIKNPSNWLYQCQGYFQQFSVEANALSYSREKVFLSFYDKEFYAKLKNYGVEAVYVEWKNSIFWSGGLHCITCDIEREND